MIHAADGVTLTLESGGISLEHILTYIVMEAWYLFFKQHWCSASARTPPQPVLQKHKKYVMYL